MFQDDPPWPPAPPPPSAAVDVPADASWRLSDLIAGTVLLGAGFFLAVGGSVALARMESLTRADPEAGLIFTVGTLLVEVWIGVVVLLLARRRGIGLRDLGFRAPRDWSALPLALLGAYASVILYGIGVLVVEEVTGWDLSAIREGNPIPEDLARTPLAWALIGVAVVVAAPVSEELFFRGLVYRGVARLGGDPLGIVASGLAFAAVHANASVVLPFAAIGMIFAWVYRSSGSLWTTIAAHAIFNSVSFVLTWYGVGS